MSHITLDVAFDTETPEETLDEIARDYSISYEIVNENGRGGGWPEVKFEGTKDNLTTMLRNCYESGDKVQDQELIDSIED